MVKAYLWPAGLAKYTAVLRQIFPLKDEVWAEVRGSSATMWITTQFASIFLH
ncbi:hypothetical protein ATANTOWER_025947, partial [Ataeniobius toweri]|nr:hypothetical protein [Ataeniobius toweri]